MQIMYASSLEVITTGSWVQTRRETLLVDTDTLLSLTEEYIHTRSSTLHFYNGWWEGLNNWWEGLGRSWIVTSSERSSLVYALWSPVYNLLLFNYRCTGWTAVRRWYIKWRGGGWVGVTSLQRIISEHLDYIESWDQCVPSPLTMISDTWWWRRSRGCVCVYAWVCACVHCGDVHVQERGAPIPFSITCIPVLGAEEVRGS